MGVLALCSQARGVASPRRDYRRTRSRPRNIACIQHEALDTILFVLSCCRQVEAQGQGDASSAPDDPRFDDALSDRIAMLFQEADMDGNGTLSRKEFQEVHHNTL